MVKKEVSEKGDNSCLKSDHRVNTTQMDDITKQMQALAVKKEEDTDAPAEEEGELQSRGPSGGVGRMTQYAPMQGYFDGSMGLPMKGGKRGMDCDFEDPYNKYNRPLEGVNNFGFNFNACNNNVNYFGQNFMATEKCYSKPQLQDMGMIHAGENFQSTGHSGEFNVDDFIEKMCPPNGGFQGSNLIQNQNQPNPFPMQGGFAPNNSTFVPEISGFQTGPSVMGQMNGGGVNDMGNKPVDYSAPTSNHEDLSFSKMQKQDKDEPTSDYESTYSPGSVTSLNSPPPSNQSHDSGYGAPSPASDIMKSPARHSTSGGSPPKDGSQWSDSPMSLPPVSPATTTQEGSRYIDDHLDDLHEVLNVIGEDIKQQHQNSQSRPPAQNAQPTKAAPLQHRAMPTQNPLPQPSPPSMMGNMPPKMCPAPPYMATQHAPVITHNAPVPSHQPPLQRVPSQGYNGQVPPVSNGQVRIKNIRGLRFKNEGGGG